MDARLTQVIKMFQSCNLVCDVGADHAHLVIELVKLGYARHGIAIDIAEKPLKTAYNNILSSGLSEKIKTLKSNGLEKLNIRPDAVIIAGMGGELIANILKESPFSKETSILYYLVPMTKPERLRVYLYSQGYKILKESCTVARNRPYSVILAQKSQVLDNILLSTPSKLYLGEIDYKNDAQCLPYFLKLRKQLGSRMKSSKSDELVASTLNEVEQIIAYLSQNK